jgi:hypothetical protein
LNEGRFWNKSIDALDEKDLAKARWFTRGWTLQELIASCEVAFYIKGWKSVGRKSSMKGKLARITGVNERLLMDFQPELSVSVAERMSWAAKRETTKGEDMAYCLLGIFGVFMPLLYGEGADKAFMRLQEQIMKDSDDQSLFAWHSNDSRPPPLPPAVRSTPSITSVFAPHPRFFSGSASHGVHPDHLDSPPYVLTNIGVRMRVPVLLLDRWRAWYLLVLNCTFGKSLGLKVGVPVKKLPGSAVARFARLGSVDLFKVVRQRPSPEKLDLHEVYVSKTITWSLTAGDEEVEHLTVLHARDFVLLTQEEAGRWEKRWMQNRQPDIDTISRADTDSTEYGGVAR